MKLKIFVLLGCLLATMTFVSCSGEDGAQGDIGLTGAPGTHGEDGDNGINCWDLDGDGINDDEEDINGDAKFDSLDCQGTNGENGDDGINCWDLNANGVGDITEGTDNEDTNGDQVVDALDCAGQDGVIITSFFFEDFEGLPDTTPPAEFVQSEIDNADWFVDLRGGELVANNALISEDINDDEFSEISISFTSEATSLIEFDVLISSENSFDFFTWSLNGQLIQGISGTPADPIQVRFIAPAGDNILTFTYDKDDSFSSGNDEVFVDNLLVNNISSVGKVNLSLPVLPENATYYSDRGNKTK